MEDSGEAKREIVGGPMQRPWRREPLKQGLSWLGGKGPGDLVELEARKHAGCPHNIA